MSKGEQLIFDLFTAHYVNDFYFHYWKLKTEKDFETFKGLTVFKVAKSLIIENEVCDEIHEQSVKLSCGCCYGSVWTNANYIKESK